MILSKLSGGLRNKRNGRGVRNRTPNILAPNVPPIHLGLGRKKNTKGITTRMKKQLQERATSGKHILTCKNEPISNCDIKIKGVV